MWIRRITRDRVHGSRSLFPEGFHGLMALAVLSILFACSCEVDESQDDAIATLPRGASLASRAEDPRPSAVLIVLDTLRADAVSSYGVVDGTRPPLDRLAREGIRYLVPGALCLAVTYPLAVRILSRGSADAGPASARVYAWNTTGAAARLAR